MVKQEEHYVAAARELRFEKSREMVAYLNSMDKDFAINMKSAFSLIDSLSYISNKYDNFYDATANLHRLNMYSSRLLLAINSIYKSVYNKTTEEISLIKKNYVERFVDSKAGELYSKLEYSSAYMDLYNMADSPEKQKKLEYLNKDLQILKSAEITVNKAHKELIYALKPETSGKETQTLEAIFLEEGLSKFGDINFTELEKMITNIKLSLSQSYSIYAEQIDFTYETIKELKTLQPYVLSANLEEYDTYDKKIKLRKD